MPKKAFRPRARRIIRILRWGLLAGALAAGAVALWPNQTLNPLTRWAAPKLAGMAGYELTVDRLEGTPWSQWNFQGLTLQPKDSDHGLRIERAGELQIALQGPVFKKPGLHNLASVRARDLTIQFVARDATSETDPVAEPSQFLTFDPTTLPELDLDRVSIFIQQKDFGTVEVADLRVSNSISNSVSASGGDKHSALRMRADGTRWTDAAGHTESVRIEAHLELQGSSASVIESAVLHPQRGRLELSGRIDWTDPDSLGGAFDLKVKEAVYQDLEGMQILAQGEILAGHLIVQELNASAGKEIVVHGKDWSIPLQPIDWRKAQGTLTAGGPAFGRLLSKVAPAAPPTDQKPETTKGPTTDPAAQPPLGAFRFGVSLQDGTVRIQPSRLTLELADPIRNVELEAEGSVSLLTRSSQGTTATTASLTPELVLQGSIRTQTGSWTAESGAHFSWEPLAAAFDYSGGMENGNGRLHIEEGTVVCTPDGKTPYTTNWTGALQLSEGSLSLDEIQCEFRDGNSDLGSVGVQGQLGTIAEWQADPDQVLLDLHAQVTLPRLGLVADWVPAIRRIEGSAHGDVYWRGTSKAPQWSGQLLVEAPTMRLVDGEGWNQVHANLDFPEANRAIFDVAAIYGGAPVTTKGEVLWKEGAPQFDIRLESQGFPAVRTPEARIRANVNLRVTGQPDSGRVEGTVDLTHGRLQHNFDLTGKLFDALEGRSKDEARPSEPLELEWPVPAGWEVQIGLNTSAPIAIVSDLVKSSLDLQGQLVARSGRLYPEGNITLGGGRVSLPGSTLRWTQGVILLPKGGGDPTIEAAGETRLSGHDVSLRIHGPITNPGLDLTSTPARPKYDLLVLLLTGELPGDRDLSRTTQSLSIFLAKDLLRRWLGSGASDEESLLDRLEISTGREVSASGLGTLEAMFRLTGQSDGRGKALWATAERDRYEDMNIGLRYVLRPKR